MPPIVGNAFRSGYKTIIYDIKDLQPCQGYSGRAEPCTHSVLTCVMSCAAQGLIYSSCRPQGRAEPCTLNVLTCVMSCAAQGLIYSSCRPQGRAGIDAREQKKPPCAGENSAARRRKTFIKLIQDFSSFFGSSLADSAAFKKASTLHLSTDTVDLSASLKILSNLPTYIISSGESAAKSASPARA